ncbi:hypothetical protein KCU90_g3324, partial [Aureobasidium melanogenum]
MMHRPNAAAHVEPVARLQRAGQVQLGVSDRACQIGALGNQRRNRRRQRAARPMRILHRHARAAQAQRPAILNEPVGTVRRAQMATLHQHRPRAKRAQRFTLFDHGGFIGGRLHT